MATKGAGWLKLVGYGVIAAQLVGCSFIAEPAPASANELRPGRNGRRCGQSFWYPVADTASVLAGATWVVRANQDLDDAGPHQETHTFSDGSQYTSETPGSGGNTDLFRAERIAGWSAIALFGASAIYGYIVETRCAALRQAAAPPAAKPAPSRPDFPGSVFGFGFSMQQEQAAQLCHTKAQTWTMEGATGLCKSLSGSPSNPEVQLAFELGTPSEIRAIYLGHPATINRDYQALSDSLRSSYGPPQVALTPLSAACASSLAQCLEAGEQPRGPVWHWKAGTIELRPSWHADHALLELRYTREEPQAQ